VGTADYGHYRADVATLFPGLHNSSGAVGFRVIDTTLLANGIHTISWVVSDDAGATEGIGSRYFHVNNASTVTAATPLAAARSAPSVADAGALAGVAERPVAEVAGTFAAKVPATYYKTVRIREMERLTFDLARELRLTPGCGATFGGGEVVGDDRRPLPAGSSLDPVHGTFAWQPGPGFIGSYRLAFAVKTCDGVESSLLLDVRIARATR
jgi:hypothetical protein